MSLLLGQEGKNDASVMFSECLLHAIDSLVDNSVISHMIFWQVHHHYQQYNKRFECLFMLLDLRFVNMFRNRVATRMTNSFTVEVT